MSKVTMTVWPTTSWGDWKVTTVGDSGRKGKVTGPPEDCYPEEPPELHEITEVYVFVTSYDGDDFPVKVDLRDFQWTYPKAWQTLWNATEDCWNSFPTGFQPEDL